MRAPGPISPRKWASAHVAKSKRTNPIAELNKEEIRRGAQSLAFFVIAQAGKRAASRPPKLSPQYCPLTLEGVKELPMARKIIRPVPSKPPRPLRPKRTRQKPDEPTSTIPRRVGKVRPPNRQKLSKVHAIGGHQRSRKSLKRPQASHPSRPRGHLPIARLIPSVH